MIFEWDDTKEAVNIKKHGVNFKTAEKAFFDTKRITTLDNAHSTDKETRYYSHLRVKIPNSCHCDCEHSVAGSNPVFSTCFGFWIATNATHSRNDEWVIIVSNYYIVLAMLMKE
ncbi:MAG: BrnT family toxin [Rickettsiales bacterium]